MRFHARISGGEGDAASPQKQKAGDPASPYKRAGVAHL